MENLKNAGLSLRNSLSVREHRERMNLTQKELASLVGVNQRSISAYESGSRKPSLKIAMKLAKIFKVKLEELLYDEL